MFVAATIDITPVTDQLIQLAILVATALLGWATWYVKNWVAKRVDLDQTTIDEQIQSLFNEAAARAMAYAATITKDALPKTVETQGTFVTIAAKYLVSHWPELLKKAGLTDEKIKTAILARLPSVQADKAEAIAMAKSGQIVEVESAPKARK